MTAIISASLTAQDQASTEAFILRNFNVSVQGTFVGTAELQRSFDLGSTWEVTDSFTSKVSTVAFEPEARVKYRFLCASLDSGTIEVRIGGNGLGD